MGRDINYFVITDSLNVESNNRSFDFGGRYCVLWRLIVENQLQADVLYRNAD
jgi:hypothetical protein